MTILASSSLINCGKLNGDDWLKFYQQATFNGEKDYIAGVKTVLATLPLAIFFHEDTIKFKNNLLEVSQVWEIEPVVKDAALALGFAIANSLTETLDPLTLISQTISFLGDTTTLLPQKLLQVKYLLEQRAELEAVQGEFSHQEQLSNNLALALYCFLSSLEDFPLTLLRANKSGRDEDIGSLGRQATTILGGALSGAYNSSVGIPPHWQMLLSTNNSPIWGENNYSQILKIANDLVTVWSGAYTITPQTHELTKAGSRVNWELDPMSIVAAPNVIRPR
jgi:ADP-ribosylglycohydrolase